MENVKIMANEMIESRPSFLAPIASTDLGDMSKFLRPPYIKVVQALSKAPFKPTFKEGDIVAAPLLLKIGDAETPFEFTPIYFFASYVCLNPIKMSNLPGIREISFDENSELAKKCLSFHKQKCPENQEYDLKFNTTLNFFVMIHGFEEIQDVPYTLSFARGEYKTGQSLIGLIQARRAYPFACRFRAASGQHKDKSNNDWQGLEISNASSPWVEDEATYRRYEKFHNDLKEIVLAKRLDMGEAFEVNNEEGNASNEKQF